METEQNYSSASGENRFIFFADICQSTALYDNLGDKAAARLMMHCLETCADRVEVNSGRMVDTRGDEVLCLFDDALEAMRAAADLHAFTETDPRCLEHRIALRIGIHFGSVIELKNEIYGDAVNLAARLADKSKAGQTLLSASVKAQSPATLDEFLRPVGSSTIRGKQGVIELFELLSNSDSEDITEVSRRVQRPRRTLYLNLSFQGKQYRLSQMTARFTLGRNTECDLCVRHASVSRLHAEIRYRNGRFHLFDVSTNGTRVLTLTDTLAVHRSDLMLQHKGELCLGRTLRMPYLHIAFTAH